MFILLLKRRKKSPCVCLCVEDKPAERSVDGRRPGISDQCSCVLPSAPTAPFRTNATSTDTTANRPTTANGLDHKQQTSLLSTKTQPSGAAVVITVPVHRQLRACWRKRLQALLGCFNAFLREKQCFPVTRLDKRRCHC